MILEPHQAGSILASAGAPFRAVAEMVLAGRSPELDLQPDRAPVLPAPTAGPGDVTRTRRLPAAQDLSLVDRSLASVIATRRSGGLRPGPLTATELATLLAATAIMPATIADSTLAPVAYPIVFDVDGIPAGAYRYDADRHVLAPIRAITRERVTETALLQHEHGTGAALLFLVVPLSRWLTAFGDRGYRGAAFSTGWITDRLYLVAETLGLTYTASGGFAPGVVDELLDIDGCERTAFFAFAVGGPRRPTRRTGGSRAIAAADAGITSTAPAAGAAPESASRLEPWCAVRVAGLPAAVLSTLRLRHAADAAVALDAIERELGQARAHAVDAMFDVVNGCGDVARRRAALDIKRRLFRGKPLVSATQDRLDAGWPEIARAALTRVMCLEQQQVSCHEDFEQTFADERALVSESFRRVLGHDRLLAGLLLSGADHLVAAKKLASVTAHAPLTSSQQLRESTVARYLFRATTRTTPFSGFAATALVRLDGTVHPHGTASWPLASPQVRWRSVPQLNLRRMQAFLARLNAAAPSHQLLRLNPLRAVLDGPEPAVVFSRVVHSGHSVHSGTGSGTGGPLEWISLQWSDTIAALLQACDGHTLDDAVRALAPDNDGQRFREALLQLIDAGLIECVNVSHVSFQDLPAGVPLDVVRGGALDAPSEVTPDGIRAVANTLRANDQPQAAVAIRGVADALDSFSTAGIDDRHALIRRIASVVDPDICSDGGSDGGSNVGSGGGSDGGSDVSSDSRSDGGDGRPPVLEDVVIDGLTAANLPITPDILLAQLQPVLRLLRASACHAAHRLMCAAFVQRFGREGVCRDVGAFVTELLRDVSFLSRIRGVSEPIGWLTSDLGRLAAAATDVDRVQIDSSLFDALVVPEGAFATALFLQFAPAADRGPGDARVIVNGAQAGRGKYLSRYLGAGGIAAETAVAAIRRRLAPREGPLPVEIAPSLGLNFQIHPLLTVKRLEIPWEPAQSMTDVLRLADLTVTFDSDTNELRTRSRQLDRDIDLVHLGFLRDALLPDPHFLLRALSPSLCEDTVAERADVYNVLDRLALAKDIPLVPHRPRLEVGAVVLERERWAVPAAVVPCREEKQSYSDYFRSISRFRRAHDLPARGFVRYVGRGAPGFGLAETRMYVDWESPLTLSGLTRFVRANRTQEANGTDGHVGGYIVMTELLPAPESSWLVIDGEAHAAEVVVELETGRPRS